MNLSVKKTILFSLVLFTSFSLKAQFDDRMITANDDTIACKLSRSMMGAFKYKTAKGDKGEVDKGEVKEFYTGDKKKWVRRVYITSQRYPCYMTVLERGKISLYEMDAGFVYYNGNSFYNNGPKTQWFVAKGTDTAELVKDGDNTLFNGRKERKTYFMQLIEDNKTAYDQYMADDKFSYEEIKRIVELYNSAR